MFPEWLPGFPAPLPPDVPWKSPLLSCFCFIGFHFRKLTGESSSCSERKHPVPFPWKQSCVEEHQTPPGRSALRCCITLQQLMETGGKMIKFIGAAQFWGQQVKIWSQVLKRWHSCSRLLFSAVFPRSFHHFSSSVYSLPFPVFTPLLLFASVLYSLFPSALYYKYHFLFADILLFSCQTAKTEPFPSTAANS